MYPYGYNYWGGPGPYYGNPYWSGGTCVGCGGPPFWANPWGLSDYDIYDYNNNLVLDDNEVIDLVRDTLEADPFIPQTDVDNIKVDVKNGVVNLTGTVRNKRSKPLAYADAFWSAGVVDVNSDIQVEAPTGGEPEGQQMMPGQGQQGQQGQGSMGGRRMGRRQKNQNR